jgi:hypothetical protein
MKKNENVRALTKFAEKKGLIEVLEQTFSYVQTIKDDNAREWRVIGKEKEQAVDRHGELRWEDDAKTIPYYRDEYGEVTLTPEEMSDEQYAKYVACETILKALEAMI